MEYLPVQGVLDRIGEEVLLGYVAEMALKNNGHTTNFGRNIWYGIVEKTSVLLEAAGETWDSTYGTAEETYLFPSGDEDQLTARRFNAVTCNIEKFLGNKWKWAVDETVEKGYLGRPRVYGVTEVGVKKADIVYGWYLIELVRVVNMFVDILYHGGYDYLEELSLEAISDSNVKALLTSWGSSPLFSYAGIDTKLKAELCIPETAEFKSEIVSKSDVFLDAKLIEFIRLNIECLNSKSYAFSKIITQRTVLLYTMLQSQSQMVAETTAKKVMQAYSQVLSCSLKQSDMKAFRSLSTGSISLDFSLVNAEILKIKPLYTTSKNISKSNTYLDLKADRPKEIASKSAAHSLVLVVLDEKLPKSFSSIVKGFSNVNIELSERQSLDCVCNGNVATRTNASLSFWIPEPEETWYDPVQNGTNLYIRNTYPQWQEGSNVYLDGGVYYEPEQAGTNVYVRSTESLKGV